MDGDLLYPKGFHPTTPLLDASGEKFASPRWRRNVPEHYFTDFGISTRFEGTETTRLVIRVNGQDDEVPEFSMRVPYDPFAVDVFILGNLFRTQFVGVCCSMVYIARSLTHSFRCLPTSLFLNHW